MMLGVGHKVQAAVALALVAAARDAAPHAELRGAHADCERTLRASTA